MHCRRRRRPWRHLALPDVENPLHYGEIVMQKSNSIHSIITGLTVLASVASVRGTDWPQWRGPNRDDISTETGLLKQWPAGGPPVAWKMTGLGAGYSGVSVDHSRIFTMGERGDSSLLFALDEASGKILWFTKLGKSGGPGWGGFAGPRGTPTVDGDRVYAFGHYGDLVCAEVATGKVLWRKNFVADFGGEVPEWGYAESPLVDGDQLICTPGKEKGALAALNKMTGETLWRTTEFTDKAAYASPIVVVIDGVRQYIQVTDTMKETASVVGVSTKGKVLWRGTFPGKTAVIPTPIYRDHFFRGPGLCQQGHGKPSRRRDPGRRLPLRLLRKEWLVVPGFQDRENHLERPKIPQGITDVRRRVVVPAR